MSHRDDDEVEVPLRELARARAQSVELAEARVRAARPFRPELLLGRRVERGRAGRPLVLVMASALVVTLLASGAWALVVARRAVDHPSSKVTPVAEPVAQPDPVAAKSSSSAAPVMAPITAPQVIAKAPSTRSARREAKRPAAPPPTVTPPVPPPQVLTPSTFVEPEGERIEVLPHQPQPPLFTPEEWKQRRAPVLE